MELSVGWSAYQRDRGNLPGLPVVNMFLEQSKTEPKQIVLQSRPGLEDNAVTSGAGPVKGIFQKDGVLDGDLFTVSAGNLYRDGASQGAVAGSGHVNFSGNEVGLVVNAGSGIYYHNGTTLSAADFPDGAAVCKVVEIAGRFVAIRTDTGAIYTTEPLANALVAGILTFGALSFVTAEDEPDPLVDAVVVAGNLILGGSETVEFWQITGDSLLPFAPILGRVYTKGVRQTGCLVEFDNTAVFVSGDGLVYRCADVPLRISEPGIEERIAASTECELSAFFWEGHEFLKLRLDTETHVFDGQTKQWTELSTSGQANFIGRCVCPGPIFGSAIDGKTLVFGDGFTDLDNELERRFRAGLVLTGGSVSIDNLSLRTNPGVTTDLGADPVVEMSYSRDGGNEFSEHRPAKLGSTGSYRKTVGWRALGMFDAPGALFEFRVTDPVDFRVSGVYANESGGGRSR